MTGRGGTSMEAILLIFDAVVVQKRGKATMAHGAHGELFFIDLPDYPGLRCDTLARSTLLFSCGVLHPGGANTLKINFEELIRPSSLRTS